MLGPCYNCEKRSPPCHGDCKEFREWQEMRQKVKAAEREEKKREDAISAVKMNGMKRVGKQIHQR